MINRAHKKTVCLVTLTLAIGVMTGCATNVGRTITPPVKSTSNEGTEKGPKPIPQSPSPKPGPTTSIRPDKLCEVPQENYNFADTLKARIGSEGVLRLNSLLQSDFKRSNLSPKDRKYLKALAKEMLWIPSSVEEQIGNAMLAYAGQTMTFVEDTADNEELWDKSAGLVSSLMKKAPETPFSTRLVIVEKGEPQSLAGGLIFIDMDTVKGAFDDTKSKKQVEKLNFIVAHELAHIYKRHRAKRLQQLLVDTDTGLKLVRNIFAAIKKETSGNDKFNISRWVQTAILIPELVDLYRKHNARYEQDQEFEADACATALMASSGVGNPVTAFQTYRVDQSKFGNGGDITNLYASHPPNLERERQISIKFQSLQVGVNSNDWTGRSATPDRWRLRKLNVKSN